jgi:hypothetical protein
VTGWEIGFVSLAVGFLVGAAMKKGAAGYGGRKYQITAAVLTYAAVSMAAIPIQLYLERDKAAATSQQRTIESAPTSSSSESGDNSPNNTQAADSSSQPKIGLAMALATLAVLGLASPFLGVFSNPLSGIIGLVILSVGIRYAWQATAAPAVVVDGPFENSVKTAAAGSL